MSVLLVFAPDKDAEDSICGGKKTECADEIECDHGIAVKQVDCLSASTRSFVFHGCQTEVLAQQRELTDVIRFVLKYECEYTQFCLVA